MKVLNVADADHREAMKMLEAAETFCEDVAAGKRSVYSVQDVRSGLRFVRLVLDAGPRIKGDIDAWNRDRGMAVQE